MSLVNLFRDLSTHFLQAYGHFMKRDFKYLNFVNVLIIHYSADELSQLPLLQKQSKAIGFWHLETLFSNLLTYPINASHQLCNVMMS